MNRSRAAEWPARLRRGALFLLFALVLLIPKTLGLRRRPRVWNALRFAVAIVGAFALASSKGATVTGAWLHSLAGLLLILLGVLLRPAREEKSVDEQARELGALVVVNGGKLCGASGQSIEARLYVGAERALVLDLAHRRLEEIPLAGVSALCAEPAEGGWKLRVEWGESRAEFLYDGFFAEHLARVAESTLRSQWRRELPILTRV